MKDWLEIGAIKKLEKPVKAVEENGEAPKNKGGRPRKVQPVIQAGVPDILNV